MNLGINIDFDQMSNLTRQLIGSSAYAGLVEHFNNPENQRRFQEWKREREKKKEGENE